MPPWSGVDALNDISAPTLVLWGDCDRTYPWSQTELLWQSIPKAALGIVPNCAHAVHSENPVVFNMLVDQFLQRTSRSARTG